MYLTSELSVGEVKINLSLQSITQMYCTDKCFSRDKLYQILYF